MVAQAQAQCRGEEGGEEGVGVECVKRWEGQGADRWGAEVGKGVEEEGDGRDYEECRRGDQGACARLQERMQGLWPEDEDREGAGQGEGEGWWGSEWQREMLWRWVWGVGGALALVCALPLTALGLVVLLIMRTVVLLPPEADTPRTPITPGSWGSRTPGSRGSLTPGSRGSRNGLTKL